jgi:hypothetical protein
MRENTKWFGRKILPLAAAIAVTLLVATLSPPAQAQKPRKFEPIPRGGIYEQTFLNHFWDALGTKPADLTWVKESETVRFLVTGAVQALKGDSEGALRTFALIPEEIASSFQFLSTMQEDLSVPELFDTWYKNDLARTNLFSFYKDTWLPHQEYRDDFAIFRDDMIGRTSRINPKSPAVWIIGNLSTYGYSPSSQASPDDPYLFIWDLMTSLTYYAQRSDYYGLIWDKYKPSDWQTSVVAKVGEIIKKAHDEASNKEMQEGYWAQLIDPQHPFEVPEGTPGTVEAPPSELSTGSGEPSVTEPGTQPGIETVQTSGAPSEEIKSETEAEAEKIANLVKELEEAPGPEVAPVKPAPEETVKPVEEPSGPEVAPEKPTPEEPVKPVEASPAPVEKPVVEEKPSIPDETPDEFEVKPSAPEAKPAPSEELSQYAVTRLGEIANDLINRIDTLATDLGTETIGLVKLYNDPTASKESISRAEDGYILKRQVFLAGIAVWDRFSMEIYSPLTLPDFDAHVIKSLRAPYDALKAGNTWDQYKAFESKFEEAYSQIETGFRSRRNDSEVQMAEEASLTANEKDYKAMVKEIEDLLSGKVTEKPK